MLSMGVLRLYKKIKNRKGLTVLELIIAIAIASIVIVISTGLFRLTTKGHSLSLKEYSLQSSIRRATEETNQTVRYCKAVFAVPQTFVADTDTMDPDWNYLMVSPDGKRIVSMEYNKDEDRFVERILVPEQKNIQYEIFFERDPAASADNLMKYVIRAYIVDGEGNKTSEKIAYETEIESVNAVQVMDKGTGIPEEGIPGAAPSIALAYLKEGISGEGRNEIAYITLVVDVSGSMNEAPDGGSTTREECDWRGRNCKTVKFRDSRIDLVKKALTGGGEKEGIIQQFAQENIYVSLVPFSTTANYPSPTATNNISTAKHPIYYVSNYNNKVNSNNSRHKANLQEEIDDKLYANGGTNTGDGLRRAYQLHNDFKDTMKIDKNIRVHHYMILLVDGETTYEVKNGNWTKGKNSNTWKFTANTSSSKYYSGEGNIEPITSANRNKDPKISYAITGTGSTFAGTGYVNAIGGLIDDLNVKSYVIGYASGLTKNINDIGAALGKDKTKVYNYDNENFNLDEVFQNIANDIMADYRTLSGPQIRN